MSTCVRAGDSRTNYADGVATAMHSRLLHVWRCARLLEQRMRPVSRGVYEIEPADVLALRVAVAAAAPIVKGVRE